MLQQKEMGETLKEAPQSFETARNLGTSMARDIKSTRSPRKK